MSLKIIGSFPRISLEFRERERESSLAKGDDPRIEKHRGGSSPLASEDREREREKEMEESIKYLHI